MFGSGLFYGYANGNPALSIDCIIQGKTKNFTSSIFCTAWSPAGTGFINAIAIGDGTTDGSKLASNSFHCIAPMPDYGIINCIAYGPTVLSSGIVQCYSFTTIPNSGLFDGYANCNGKITNSFPGVVTGF